MKGGTILAVGASVALAAVALFAHEWRNDLEAESSAARGAMPRNGTDERNGDAAHGGSAAHAKPGTLAGGGMGGIDRSTRDDSPSARRAGSSMLVRGAAQLAGSGNAATAAGAGSMGAKGGDLLSASHAEAGKREIPDMPKQTSSAAAELNGAVPDAAPEVAYDGGPDHVFSTNSQVQVPDAANITGDAGTVSFWLKPQWGPNSQDDATFVQLGDSGLQVVKNVDFLRFEYLDGNGTENGLGTNIDNWPTNQWRQVTATWDGSTLWLYVDGQLISQNHYQYPPTFGEETKLLVGTAPGSPVAPGQLSTMLVLNRSASPDEILQQFQSGVRPQ